MTTISFLLSCFGIFLILNKPERPDLQADGYLVCLLFILLEIGVILATFFWIAFWGSLVWI